MRNAYAYACPVMVPGWTCERRESGGRRGASEKHVGSVNMKRLRIKYVSASEAAKGRKNNNV